MREDFEQEQEEVCEVSEEDILQSNVGVSILLVTLMVALAIVVVGITVPIIEARYEADPLQEALDAVRAAHHDTHILYDQTQDLKIQQLIRRVSDIEKELKAGGGGP